MFWMDTTGLSRMDGKARDVAVSSDGTYWMLGFDRADMDPAGSDAITSSWRWVAVSGYAVTIDAASHERAAVCNAGGQLYAWYHNDWISVGSCYKDVSICDDGTIWTFARDPSGYSGSRPVSYIWNAMTEEYSGPSPGVDLSSNPQWSGSPIAIKWLDSQHFFVIDTPDGAQLKEVSCRRQHHHIWIPNQQPSKIHNKATGRGIVQSDPLLRYVLTRFLP